jgi:hypothetical protein
MCLLHALLQLKHTSLTSRQHVACPQTVFTYLFREIGETASVFFTILSIAWPATVTSTASTKKNLERFSPIDMFLSAVSVLVVAQSISEIPEGLMNNPLYWYTIRSLPYSPH